MEQETNQSNPVRVGISHGDLNGIGYEIILKSLADNRINELMIPIVYGSSKIVSYQKKLIELNEFSLNQIKSPSQANQKRANIIEITEQDIQIDLGQSTEIAGKMAFLSLEKAVDDLINNQIDVLVTAPINKKNIQTADFSFPGHTEYLASKCNEKEALMFMVSGDLRVGVVTGHIPIEKVSKSITQELILQKLAIMERSLLQDFGIRKPRIAVLGLNPHAGENGVLGNEEIDMIKPAVKTAFEKGIWAFGPYPADGFFGSGEYKKFDAVLAMYHDQGLIPFKSFTYDNGVNFTAGLPIIRTSPAHGTAYEIAGKNIAHEGSMRAAMYLACDIFRNRKLHKQISADPLKQQVKRSIAGRDE